jgi:quinol monooxygenase YgiN
VLALIVSLYVSLDTVDSFVEAIAEQRHATLTHEDGCVHFDVARDVADPGHFVFYEIYVDNAALEHHRTTPHFHVWRSAAEKYVLKDPPQVNTVCSLLPAGDADQG